MIKKKQKAIIFIGFRHKKENIITAKKDGYKTILLTRKTFPGAEGLFDEIIENNILETSIINKIIPYLRGKYSIKGILSNYEHYVVVRSYLAEHFGLPSTSVYGACCSRNKAMQRHAFKFMNENINHRIVKTEKQAEKAFYTLKEDVFLKSIAGIKSRLIFHIKSKNELKKAFKKLLSKTSKLDEDLYNDFNYCNFNFEYPDPRTTFLIEKAEYGDQLTISSFAGSYKIWHTPSACDVYQASRIGRNDSFLAFRITPSKFSEELINRAKRVTETAAQILGLKFCPIFCELIINKRGEIKIVEIASRMGGYRPLMYKNAYGIDLNKLTVETVIGEKIEIIDNLKEYVSMCEIFPQKKGKFKKIQGMKILNKDSDISDMEIMAKTNDKVGLAKNNHPPCLRFLIHGKTYNEVYEKSVRYQKILKVELR